MKPSGSRAPRVYPCPERPILLTNLAGVLMYWESAHASAPYVDFFSAYQHQVVDVLENLWSVLLELPQRGMLLDEDPSLHDFIQKMTHNLWDKLRQSRLVYRAQAGQRMPAAPFHDARSLTMLTVQTMAEDFRAFGPATFSREAIYRAVVAILEACGVPSIQGKSWTAAGINKLLARHPPYMRSD